MEAASHGSMCYLMTMGKKAYYTYMVLCSDNSLYTGYAADVEARIALHNLGSGAKYVRGRLPVMLVYSKEHNTRSEAQAYEAYIKKLRRSKKLLLIKTWFGETNAPAQLHNLL